MRIPDPTEILDSQIEEQAELIDAEGKHPCARCGVRFPAGEMFEACAHPASPLICGSCVPTQPGGKSDE